VNRILIIPVLALIISVMVFSIPDAKATDGPGSATHLSQSQIPIHVGTSVNILSTGPFTTFDPKNEGFTQEVYGAYNMFFGGVAFSRHGDPIVNSCQYFNSNLVKFLNSSSSVVHGSTIHTPVSIPSSPAGCGMTNSPDGFIYSNTSTGVRKFDDNGTEVPIAGTMGGVGVAGNALGIAVQPGTKAVFYVTASSNIERLNATTGVSTAFLSVGGFVDQIVFDGTGKYLYLAERSGGYAVKVLDTTIPAIVQTIALPTEPDGMAIHIPSNTLFVVSTAGTIERVYLSNNTSSTFASGGFRGDNSQVGPDGCLYLVQEGTRYNDGTTTTENSLVRVCPNFVAPIGVNQPPMANDDYAKTNENTTVTINVLANDTDTDGDTLSVISNTVPANGAAKINPDYTITYTPNTGFIGNDTFQYTISDGHGGKDSATVHVQVGSTTSTVTITTKLSSSITYLIGPPVTDSATLSGVTSDASGTVTYKLFKNNYCTGTPILTSKVTVTNGLVPNSKSFQPKIGSYNVQAVYSGDSKNAGATSQCGTEPLWVKPLTVTTKISKFVIHLGKSVTDSAHLLGATSNANGTLTYNFYFGETCTTSPVFSSQVAVTNGLVPNSASFQPALIGTYHVQAAYSGDTNNSGATSKCGSEHFRVIP
jgi:hypothetical protein